MTSPPPPRDDELDLTAPLPSGTVVLEASAGTGKTYAIAALVTRAVAEGRCRLPELLVVTFTRAATAELRDRVRRRLVEADRHLRATLAGRGGRSDDQVLAHLAAADVDELARRQERLAAALTDFDAATISTIHGFTQQVLRSVGLSADVPREPTLLEDPAELIEEVVDDVYVRRYLGRADDPYRPTRGQAVAIATAVAADPDAPVRPDDDTDPAGAERAALALALRDELAARKRADGLLDHDDLLRSLRAALRDPARGDAAVAVLRERYRWALVDEFQDTDPVQWDILARAFRDPADPQRALVLLGDPKQAIYGFRGADVRAYLAATELADRRLALRTNHRSDGPLLTALDRLLDGTRFGEDAIRFASVRAVEQHRTRAVLDDADPIDDDGHGAALQLRVTALERGATGADAARRRIGDDVAAVLLDQLGRVRVGGDQRLLRPQDVAVLVRTNAEARAVQQALRRAAVPAVVNGVGSVLATDAGADWRWLLEALERPSDPARIRRLVLSTWVGWDATRLGGATVEDLDDQHATAHRWATVLADHGVATLERTVLAQAGVPQRLLRHVGGERHLTDLRHVGELLHAAERDEDRGVSSLRSWLAEATAEAGDTPTPSDEQARRLESDAAAVQILTVHRSKGLEYPVVLVPFHWSPGQGVQVPVVAHDPDTGRRVIDVGPGERPGLEPLKALATRERVGELLRLLYVAVTRARHRTVVWWPVPAGVGRSPLGRVLFGRDPDGRVALDQDPRPPEDTDEVVAHLRDRFRGTATSVTVVADEADDARTWSGPDRDPPTLRAARFDRTLDRTWRRTSYSAVVAQADRLPDPVAADATPVGTEPDVRATDDEPVHDGAWHDGSWHEDAWHDEAARVRPGDGAVPRGPSGDVLTSPLAALRGSAAFGTLVHDVLEHTDLAADDLPGEVTAVIAERQRHHRVPGWSATAPAVLRDGLVAAIRTPLGPLAGRPDGATRWRRLADVTRRDRRDELDFELPLAGGDRRRDRPGAVTLRRLADLLDRPAAAGGLTDDDPVRAAGYADRLRAPGFDVDLRGYLTGSIDLLLRVADGGGAPRYLVVDHKTNTLGARTPADLADGADTGIGAYHPHALAAAMVAHDYPLQALLYAAAVHRFLRWRQPGYDPDVHLGGVLYLFLRGMVGPDTPTVDGVPYGVFSWRPATAVVTDLSDLLAGVEVDAADGGTDAAGDGAEVAR